MSAMSPQLMVVFIAMMIGIHPIAIDLFLPGLSALTRDLHTSVAQAQLTLTGLLLPFGLSQLVWGPLSDRFGRKPVLMVGLAGFTIAAVACALTPSIEALLAWRSLQGAAMGAIVMSGRAVLRDGFEPAEAVRVMSRAQTGLGVIACVGPLAGGLLAEYFGWRWSLAFIAGYGALALALVALRFRETLPRERRAPLHPADLARNCVIVLRHPTFLTWSLLSLMTFAGLVTFLTASPFLFTEVLGLSRVQFGLSVFSMSVCYLAGTVLCRRLLARFDLRKTVAIAGALSLAAGTLMGLLTLAGLVNIWTLLPPLWVYAMGHGIHQSCGQAGAVSPFPRMAGAASAMNGVLMMSAAFLIGGWLGRHMDGTVAPMTYSIWLWSVLLAVVAWTLVQRHGEVRERRDLGEPREFPIA
jgi:DHA1 family bicyclomycin/chloramphenicol resistance-like MFS transporter